MPLNNIMCLWAVAIGLAHATPISITSPIDQSPRTNVSNKTPIEVTSGGIRYIGIYAGPLAQRIGISLNTISLPRIQELKKLINFNDLGKKNDKYFNQVKMDSVGGILAWLYQAQNALGLNGVAICEEDFPNFSNFTHTSYHTDPPNVIEISEEVLRAVSDILRNKTTRDLLYSIELPIIRVDRKPFGPFTEDDLLSVLKQIKEEDWSLVYGQGLYLAGAVERYMDAADLPQDAAWTMLGLFQVIQYKLYAAVDGKHHCGYAKVTCGKYSLNPCDVYPPVNKTP